MMITNVFTNEKFLKAALFFSEVYKTLQSQMKQAAKIALNLKEVEGGRLTIDDYESAVTRQGMSKEDILLERAEQLETELECQLKICANTIQLMDCKLKAYNHESFLEDMSEEETFEELYKFYKAV